MIQANLLRASSKATIFSSHFHKFSIQRIEAKILTYPSYSPLSPSNERDRYPHTHPLSLHSHPGPAAPPRQHRVLCRRPQPCNIPEEHAGWPRRQHHGASMQSTGKHVGRPSHREGRMRPRVGHATSSAGIRERRKES